MQGQNEGLQGGAVNCRRCQASSPLQEFRALVDDGYGAKAYKSSNGLIQICNVFVENDSPVVGECITRVSSPATAYFRNSVASRCQCQASSTGSSQHGPLRVNSE